MGFHSMTNGRHIAIMPMLKQKLNYFLPTSRHSVEKKTPKLNGMGVILIHTWLGYFTVASGKTSKAETLVTAVHTRNAAAAILAWVPIARTTCMKIAHGIERTTGGMGGISKRKRTMRRGG